jgi:hypothetical protein
MTNSSRRVSAECVRKTFSGYTLNLLQPRDVLDRQIIGSIMEVNQEKRVARELAGLLWTWWQGDELPALARVNDLMVATTTDYELLADLAETELIEMRARAVSQYRPYVAWVAGTPVAYGWSAAGRSRFGRPVVEFTVPRANRYLLDFATLPAWRGRGIYPHVLQTIIAQESGDVERFWILHQAGNEASRRGIAKAGFQQAAEIQFLEGGGLGVVATGNNIERARAGAAVLGLPLAD